MRPTPYATAMTVCAVALTWPATSQGQVPLDRQIREYQARLDSIRREREVLGDELERLRGRARDLSDEIQNIERQRNLTSRVVNELDRQMASLTTALDTITMDLLLAQDALVEKRAVLERRLAQIYKRGRLYAIQVLLAAESFGDLLSRYKYLHLVSRQDRALVQEVEYLRDRIGRQRQDQVSVRQTIAAQREQRGEELLRYTQLEQRRQRSLRQTQASRQAATSRLDELERAEGQLNQLVANLEAERRRAIARGDLRSMTGTISTDDLGRLEWPLEGEIIYRFGRAPGPSGTSISYQGIGISAPHGTPVRAVAGGEVLSAGPLQTYGLGVIINHGAGFWTLYLYLSGLEVTPGQTVSAGQVIGRTGGAQSGVGPHLEFQIREAAGDSQRPIPLDPENWLRRRR